MRAFVVFCVAALAAAALRAGEDARTLSEGKDKVVIPAPARAPAAAPAAAAVGKAEGDAAAEAADAAAEAAAAAAAEAAAEAAAAEVSAEVPAEAPEAAPETAARRGPRDAEPSFDDWLTAHGLWFPDTELPTRRAAYAATVAEIGAHNARFRAGQASYWQATNAFSAHTPAEWAAASRPRKDSMSALIAALDKRANRGVPRSRAGAAAVRALHLRAAAADELGSAKRAAAARGEKHVSDKNAKLKANNYTDAWVTGGAAGALLGQRRAEAAALAAGGSVDWTAKGSVTPWYGAVTAVQNQRRAEDCYIFSAMGAITGAAAIATRRMPVDLSTQQAGACGHFPIDGGGGDPWEVMTWVGENGGVCRTCDYPNEDEDAYTALVKGLRHAGKKLATLLPQGAAAVNGLLVQLATAKNLSGTEVKKEAHADALHTPAAAKINTCRTPSGQPNAFCEAAASVDPDAPFDAILEAFAPGDDPLADRFFAHHNYAKLNADANASGLVAGGTATHWRPSLPLFLDYLSRGPVSVCIDDGPMSFQRYGGGLYNDSCYYTEHTGGGRPVFGTAHCILATGFAFDTEYNQLVIKLKNQWGTSWGEGGYVLFPADPAINAGLGQCNFLSTPTQPNFMSPRREAHSSTH